MRLGLCDLMCIVLLERMYIHKIDDTYLVISDYYVMLCNTLYRNTDCNEIADH